MNTGRILVVDDEKDALKLLKLELVTEGYEVLTAETSQDAIKSAVKTKPDLIIMDVLLPDMTGAEAVKILHDNASTSQIPVIFLTALFTKKEQTQHKMLNVDQSAYLTMAKPFKPEEVLAEVRHVLNKKVAVKSGR